MKFSCNFDDLVQNLADISEVVEDSLLSEDMRNVIFEIKRDAITLVGINQLIVFRRPLDHQYFTIIDSNDSEYNDEGICYIQLKSKELSGFLGAYKGVRHTSVDEVTFETGKNGVLKCTVVEKDLEDGKLYSSSWAFNIIEVKRNMLPQLQMKRPDGDLETINSNSLMFYTRNMLPILQAGTSLYSKLIFGEDYVVAFDSTHVTFMKNIIGGSLSGFSLLYRGVTFLDKVICNSSLVSIAKMERHLFFETENSQAFIIYDNRMPDYSMYIKMFKRDHAFMLDRVYLKDILKRLKLLNESVEFVVNSEGHELLMKNTKYIQGVPLLQEKALDEYGTIKFKVMPEVLNKAVIGSDDEFSSGLYVYYCLQPNKSALLVFSDDSDSWFSTISIKPY